MPKKTDEATREKVLELLKAGKSYSLVGKETGLSRPVIWGIKKEAGLVNSTHQKPDHSSENQSKSGRNGSGNGLNEMQPPPLQRTQTQQRQEQPQSPNDQREERNVRIKPERLYLECEHCGTGFYADKPEDAPEVCPECGK